MRHAQSGVGLARAPIILGNTAEFPGSGREAGAWVVCGGPLSEWREERREMREKMKEEAGAGRATSYQHGRSDRLTLDGFCTKAIESIPYALPALLRMVTTLPFLH